MSLSTQDNILQMRANAINGKRRDMNPRVRPSSLGEHLLATLRLDFLSRYFHEDPNQFSRQSIHSSVEERPCIITRDQVLCKLLGCGSECY